MAQLLNGICVLLLAQIFVVHGGAVDPESGSSTCITKAFQKLEIVPKVIPKAPTATLSVEYSSGVKAQLGNELTPTNVKCLPTLNWKAEEGAYYLILQIDPDVPSREDQSRGPWKQWLVGNVPGTDVSKGQTLAEYISSAPQKETGKHRYVILVYKQPGLIKFAEPILNNTSTAQRKQLCIPSLLKKYKIDNVPEAGNAYEAEYDDYVDHLLEQVEGKAEADPCTLSSRKSCH